MGAILFFLFVGAVTFICWQNSKKKKQMNVDVEPETGNPRNRIPELFLKLVAFNKIRYYYSIIISKTEMHVAFGLSLHFITQLQLQCNL